MGVEQLPNVRRREPVTYNRDSDPGVQFTETQYRIANPDGSTTEVDYYHKGHYIIRWNGSDESPNAFFHKAQGTVNKLKSIPSIKPMLQKAFRGLDYWLKDAGSAGDLTELDIETFSPQSAFENHRNLESARFSTLYGDFSYWESDRF